MALQYGINPCCEISLGLPQMNTLTGPNEYEILDEEMVDGVRWVTIALFGRRLSWFSNHNKCDYYVHANSTSMMTLVDMKEELYIMYLLAWS